MPKKCSPVVRGIFFGYGWASPFAPSHHILLHRPPSDTHTYFLMLSSDDLLSPLDLRPIMGELKVIDKRTGQCRSVALEPEILTVDSTRNEVSNEYLASDGTMMFFNAIPVVGSDVIADAVAAWTEPEGMEWGVSTNTELMIEPVLPEGYQELRLHGAGAPPAGKGGGGPVRLARAASTRAVVAQDPTARATRLKNHPRGPWIVLRRSTARSRR